MNDSCSFITVEAERNPESLRKDDDDVRNSTFLVEGEEASLGSWLALYLQLVSYACLKDDDDDSRQEQDVNQEAPTSDVPKADSSQPA